jgi:hypothetical protein
MRHRIIFLIAVCFFLIGTAAHAETRVYRQFRDVSTNEKGQVRQSAKQENLFECTYVLDKTAKTITRVKIRRLDDKTAGKDDNTVYNIMEKRALLGSEAGNGGKVMIAVSKDGTEILEMGHRFAFTMRTSPFSFVITGVYRRLYDKDHDFDKGKHFRKDKDKDAK